MLDHVTREECSTMRESCRRGLDEDMRCLTPRWIFLWIIGMLAVVVLGAYGFVYKTNGAVVVSVDALRTDVNRSQVSINQILSIMATDDAVQRVILQNQQDALVDIKDTLKDHTKKINEVSDTVIRLENGSRPHE